jgi:hypothetical protein
VFIVSFVLNSGLIVESVGMKYFFPFNTLQDKHLFPISSVSWNQHHSLHNVSMFVSNYYEFNQSRMHMNPFSKTSKEIFMSKNLKKT